MPTTSGLETNTQLSTQTGEVVGGQASVETNASSTAQVALETTTQSVAPTEDLPHAVLSFDGQLVCLTWIAFLIAAVVLHRLLWKPLMRFIESREGEIRQSLVDAETAKKAAAEADVAAAKTLSDAAMKAREASDAAILASQQQVAMLESEAKAKIAAQHVAAEARMEAERTEALAKLNERAGGEIATVLERMLPGMLTAEQKTAYQDKIAAEIRFESHVS